MKSLNSVFHLITLLMTLTLWTASATANQEPREASESARRTSAKEKLTQNPESVVLYARGLCCTSCAIGIRKKVNQLDFVDRKRFNKGVDLDAKTQLVNVALLEGKTINYKQLANAVLSAGYDPVNIYKLLDGQLIIQPLGTVDTQ